MKSMHLTWSVALIAAATVATSVSAQAAKAPASAAALVNGVWVDSLDLTKATGGRIGKAGLAAIFPRAARGSTTPPPPSPPISVEGMTYVHGVSVTPNTELWIDLAGKAARFVAVAGVDDARKGGRGSVTFEVWVDGTKRFDTGVIKSGEPAKRISVPLLGAHRMVLFVTDGGDGATDDIADWAGAKIFMINSTARPVTAAIPTDPMPMIASSRTAIPRLNSPRITGATPGRPFLFQIPASGEGPLVFGAKNLPPGLSLDGNTGIISGVLRDAGHTQVEVTVSGPKGAVTGDITIVGGIHKLALTPPLGWNSWNVWGPRVDDAKVRAAADALVNSGLAAQGYTYVNIDDAWEGPRDSTGEITTNQKFPDMKALADYVHSKGLKIGIYSGPGARTCQGFPASYQHEAQDAKTWAKWGFDYIKYDWCSYDDVEHNRDSLPGLQKPYALLRAVLDGVDRDFVMSLCQYGWGKVWTWGGDIGGNLWRVTGDINDSWSSMSGIGFAQTGHEQYAGPGHWNDTDMLVVGKLGWGDSNLRTTHLTPNEQITHITLWSLQGAPLLIGADLSQIDEFTTDLLGNPEVLAVNQDPLGRAAGRTLQSGRVEVWARPLADGTIAVGLFNRDLVARAITVKWSDLGIAGSQAVRDLWRQKDLGPRLAAFTATVPRHGAVLVKIGTPKVVAMSGGTASR